MHRPNTTALRLLLALLLLGLVGGIGIVYLLGVESARIYPEVAHLRLPIFVAIVIGLVPVIMGVKSTYEFLRLVDRGEAFSEATISLFRRLKILLAITAGYLVLGFFAVMTALQDMHPFGLLAWAGAQVIVLFLLALAILLQRLFTSALEMRQENEMTV